MNKFKQKKIMDISTLNEIVKKCQNFLGYIMSITPKPFSPYPNPNRKIFLHEYVENIR